MQPIRVHRGAYNGFTACGIYIPDLPDDDTYWVPAPGDAPPGPITCEFCLSGKLAPLCSTDPYKLRMAVVYGSPLDFPGEFVAREVLVHRKGQHPGEIVARAKSLGEVRDTLRGRGFSGFIHRHPEDDPTIIEVWL